MVALVASIKWHVCSSNMHHIDISKFDLNLLAVFEALLEERHVGRAAVRLRLSQSATSHALGRLRRLFDDPLFVRHVGGVEPTARARKLAAPLAEALAHVRRVVGPVDFDPATLQRTFTVATHEYVVAVLMPSLTALLRGQAKGVDIRCIGLSYRDLATALARGDVDVACGAFPVVDARRVERMPLFTDSFVGVASVDHPGLIEGRASIEAFASSPHVWVSIGNEPYDPIADALALQGYERRIAVTVPTASSVPAIVALSDLIGVMPARLADLIARPIGLAVFDLPVATNPVSCDLLIPVASSGTPEAQWLHSVFVQAAAIGDG